jgi:hypothetical protein
MKILIFFAFLSFFKIAGAEERILRAPFFEKTFSFEFGLKSKLVTPQLVSDESFKEAVMSDCDRFTDMLAKYGDQINDADMQELVKAPVAYTMKNDFEIEVTTESSPQLLLADGVSRLLTFFNEDGIAAVVTTAGNSPAGLTPEALHVVPSGDRLRITFLRRDLFCSFMKEKSYLELTYDSYLKLGADEATAVTENLKIISNRIGYLAPLADNKRRQAALIGLELARLLKSGPLTLSANLKSVDYLWSLLFEAENSLEKTGVWSLDAGKIEFRQSPVKMQLKGIL